MVDYEGFMLFFIQTFVNYLGIYRKQNLNSWIDIEKVPKNKENYASYGYLSTRSSSIKVFDLNVDQNR